jgi:hypothetical protein
MIGMMAVELISRRLMGDWLSYVEHAACGNKYYNSKDKIFTTNHTNLHESGNYKNIRI